MAEPARPSAPRRSPRSSRTSTRVERADRLQLLLEFSDELPALPERYAGRSSRWSRSTSASRRCSSRSRWLGRPRRPSSRLFFDAPPEAPDDPRVRRHPAARASTGCPPPRCSRCRTTSRTSSVWREAVSPLRLRGMVAMLARIKRQVRLKSADLTGPQRLSDAGGTLVDVTHRRYDRRPRSVDPATLSDALAASGLQRGEAVAVAVSSAGAGLWSTSGGWAVRRQPPDAWSALRPGRAALAAALGVVVGARVRGPVAPARPAGRCVLGRRPRCTGCWPAARTTIRAGVWAVLAGLDPAGAPRTGQLDLLGRGAGRRWPGDLEEPVLPSGHLRAEWAPAAGDAPPERLARWAGAGLGGPRAPAAALLVGRDLQRRPDRHGAKRVGRRAALRRARARRPARGPARGPSSSWPTASASGRATGARGGPAPARRRGRAAACRRRRSDVDLRNPAQVRAAARPGRHRRAGHPVLAAGAVARRRTRWSTRCSTWRKAERIATTYGYALAGPARGPGRPAARRVDGQRRRGRPDDRAGRPAQPARRAAPRRRRRAGARAGPRRPRPGRAAGAGGRLRRPGAGRRHRATTTCTRRWPQRLGVERPVAKVAVLAAMYGQTSGAAGQALRGLERAYPVAMALPARRATSTAAPGQPVRTHGGRLVRMCRLPRRPDERAAGPPRAAAGGSPATRSCRGPRPSCSRRGRHGARGAPTAGRRRSCCACTTSCWCRRPRQPATGSPASCTARCADVGARWAPRPRAAAACGSSRT